MDDATETRASKPPVHETEQLKLYFEHIFANSRDMMNLFSLTQNRVILMNKATEEAMGYSLEQLASAPIQELYPADELPKLAVAFERLRRTGYSSDKLKMHVSTGELRDIWTRSYVIQREPESICLVHTIDVTEENRKQERELRNARLATLGEASATLAHELMNALQAMQFNLQFLRKHIAANNAERTEVVLQRLERAVTHMDDVISGIQKFARNSKQGGAYVSVPKAVQDALQLMLGYIDSKGVTVETVFQEQLGLVWSERAQLEQILIILIKNAVQAMAARAERKLLVTAKEHGGRVCVDIVDTGGGLPAEVEARIFQAFTTTKPVGVGMGLGLATAKQLALNNGIDLRFASSPGVGTTFTLEFVDAREIDAAALGLTAIAGRNLLVVGDDAETLEATSSALLNAGARVLVATSVPEAIQLLRVHAVAAVLCDDAMYPIKAHAFVMQARTVYHGPICLLTGDADPVPPDTDLRIESMLQKPVQATVLVDAVSSLVQ